MTTRNTRAAAAGVLGFTLAAGVLLGVVWARKSPDVPEPVASTAVAAEEAEEDRRRESRRRGLIVERVGLSAEAADPGGLRGGPCTRDDAAAA